MSMTCEGGIVQCYCKEAKTYFGMIVEDMGEGDEIVVACPAGRPVWLTYVIRDGELVAVFACGSCNMPPGGDGPEWDINRACAVPDPGTDG